MRFIEIQAVFKGFPTRLMRYQVDSIEETDKNVKSHYLHSLELGHIDIGIALRLKKHSRSNFTELDSITMTTNWYSLTEFACAVSEIEIDQNGLMHVYNFQIHSRAFFAILAEAYL